ncbi:MAG: PAS domain-containing hybrid sensor histidine kinase/response regulator [Prosthecobacter sp.]
MSSSPTPPDVRSDDRGSGTGDVGLIRRLEEKTLQLEEANRSLRQKLDEQQKREAALRASEANLAIAQRIAEFGSWEMEFPENDEQTGRKLRWSLEAYRISGVEPGSVELSSAFFYRLVPPEEHEMIRQELAAALRERRQYRVMHHMIRPVDGQVRIVQQRAEPVICETTGRLLRLAGTVHDITELKNAEDKLREQATLLDQAKDAILVRDLDHQILYWNRGAERMYGWTAQEAVGRSIKELLYGNPSEFMAATDEVIAKGEWSGDIRQVDKQGEKLIVEAHWTLVRDEHGQPKSILAINTDITDKRQLEQQFLRAQRMESIGTLAGGIAHDLNNVLSPILMSIELLRLRESDTSRLKVLATIESSAKRGADMVRQVLSFARGVAGQQVEVAIKPLLKEIEKMTGETFLKNIQVGCEIPADLWNVQGDPTQLHQVFLNLCVNARDAMPDGGALTISARNEVLDENYAGMHLEAKPGPCIVVQVEDTGSGMPPEVIERIFEPFFTTKEPGKGTGLGLSTATAIVKSHGGFMRVYSEPGVGTRFCVHLPALPAAIVAAPPPALGELPRGRGENVLLVDDEAAVRQITRETLEAFGYRVMLACDGAEATTLYAAHKNTIDVVLTDMMMPLMDGPMTIQVLKQINPQARIIAASGLNVNGMVAKASSAGVRHFIPKPYTAETLLRTLAALLAET